MTYNELQQRLSDLIAFQCVLVSLRGVSTDASEEMLWQTLLAALAEQYVLHRVWYGRYADGRLRPVVSVHVGGCGLDDLPVEIEETFSHPGKRGPGLTRVARGGQSEGRHAVPGRRRGALRTGGAGAHPGLGSHNDVGATAFRACASRGHPCRGESARHFWRQS